MSGTNRASQGNWLLREASKADPRADRIVLENPEVVGSLDAKLRETFLPFIRAELKQTGFPYEPSSDELHLESKWFGPEFARALSFMLFDHFAAPFMRCTLECSRRGHLLEREFYLGLPETTDPRFLFRILSEPRLAGCKPSLTIERSVLHPEWNSYFWIEIEAGSGFEFGSWTMDKVAMGNIGQTIRDSCEMYEVGMVEGFTGMEDVERFLDIACRCFESE
jgi:hypothetical protein